MVAATAGLTLAAATCVSDEPTVHGTGHLIGRATFETSHGQERTTFLSVADSPAEHARGLMGRTTIPKDGGMLFLYDEPRTGGFWMKNTRFPLSIALLDEDRRVVDILDMEPCEADACPGYFPSGVYVTALEMRQGWFEEHGVRIGDEGELTVATE